MEGANELTEAPGDWFAVAERLAGEGRAGRPGCAARVLMLAWVAKRQENLPVDRLRAAPGVRPRSGTQPLMRQRWLCGRRVVAALEGAWPALAQAPAARRAGASWRGGVLAVSRAGGLGCPLQARGRAPNGANAALYQTWREWAGRGYQGGERMPPKELGNLAPYLR